MVWGSLGYGGFGEFAILPRNEMVYTDVYYTILNDLLEAAFEKSTTSILSKMAALTSDFTLSQTGFGIWQGKFIENWLGNSPDFSLIENVREILKVWPQGTDISQNRSWKWQS